MKDSNLQIYLSRQANALSKCASNPPFIAFALPARVALTSYGDASPERTMRLYRRVRTARVIACSGEAVGTFGFCRSCQGKRQ
jgi:hypothetical protein